MPLYMAQFSYTSEAWASFAKNPVDRKAVLQAVAEKMGCRVTDLYYSFGEYDGVLIFEAPDSVTAASLVVGAAAAGHLKSNKTTELFTVSEGMQIMRNAGGLGGLAPSS